MSTTTDPLVAPPPAEVPLREAPLVRVIAQLRFPEILAVEQRDVVAPFQAAIRAVYPVLRQETTHGILLTRGEMGQPTTRTVWRFTDSEGYWRVSLASDFLALETTKYVSRDDFFERLAVIAGALEAHFQPARIDRLGVRYIDRMTGDAVRDITQLVRPEVRGLLGSAAGGNVSHSLTETRFELATAGVLARWGLLPAGATFDAGAMEPANESGWVLDLDMFSKQPMPFDVAAVTAEARQYAQRIYTIFRWAVTDEFLVRHGGQP